MMSKMKELEEENRRLRRMYVEEKLKADIVAEALEKEWRGHLGDARWPNVLSRGAAFRFGRPAICSGSASRATGMSQIPTPRMNRSRTG